MEESFEPDQDCSSSASAPLHPTFAASPTSSPFLPDEISLLLHQILRSSSSSSSSFSSSSFSSLSPIVSSSPLPSFFPGITGNPMALLDYSPPSLPLAAERRLSTVISSDVINQSSSGLVLDRTDVPYREDWDCESEGGLEGLVEQVSAKPVPRTTSKRSRAAQVHNLSEKRRRSRINEKLKALQNLIPNSSKTDKASVLDEAIEYLKQLLLQLQMLSIRSGFDLQTISLPVPPPPIKLTQNRINIGEEDSSAHLNMANTLSLHQQIALHLQKSSKEMNRFDKLEVEKIDVDHLEAKQPPKFLPFTTIGSSAESPFSLFPPT